jgi:UDP-N-acetylmuramate--alanine ligase
MRDRGVRIHSGHSDSYLPRDVSVLVHSPAVGPSNPEFRMAERLGIPRMTYSQMLGHLMRDRTGVAVAGTHGKSTTTAICASILRDSHLSCSAVFGAELCGSGVSGWAGKSKLLVTESCEYQRSFLDLTPRFATILGIEPDHFDCYKTFDETLAAFASFAQRVEEGGVVLIHRECAASASAVERASAEVVTFSNSPGADWWAADERATDSGTRFRVFFRGDYFGEFRVPLRGRHNLLNALASIALCHHAGASASEISQSIAGFPGIRRRFETVGWWRERRWSTITRIIRRPSARRCNRHANNLASVVSGACFSRIRFLAPRR